MPDEINQVKQYELPAAKVTDSALKAIAGLEGQVLKQDAAGQVEAKFDKKILGKLLGDRTYLSVKDTPLTDETNSLVL